MQSVGRWDSEGEHDSQTGPDSVAVPMDWTTIGADWREAIYAEIVDKVGERDYWENWARNVAEIAARHQTRIRALVQGSNAALRAGSWPSWPGCRTI